MKQVIVDETEVRALAERLGAWTSIADSIDRSHSGSPSRPS